MHEHGPQPAGLDSASWEERYRAAPSLWSGRANDVLVAEAADLTPGRALDVGCGEGGDVLWLAGRGWQVTGLDWSEVALARAAEHAAAAGLTARVEWVRGDVATHRPPQVFHLVTAHFLHPDEALRRELVPRLAAAVVPGGTLLWVGHAFDEERAAVWGADRFAAAGEVAADLDPRAWEVLVAERRPRPGGGHGDHHADEVLRARRR
ncbi:SAM-dependent methyltransferase [Geodermatophilus sp. SYSU D00965]